MPQTKAAKKALKSSDRKRVTNDRWRKKMREVLHAVHDAVSAKDKKAADQAYTQAQSTLDRAARRNIIHPNKAARKKARLKRAISNIK